LTNDFTSSYDEDVVGAGPNGLDAAIELARSGHLGYAFKRTKLLAVVLIYAELTLSDFVR
jgi:ribulose 1,5-bisphosphate synthetase/thiazole synthase